MTDLATVSADFFRPHVGGTIALADEAGTVLLTATLRQVDEQPRSTAPDSPRVAFTLELSAPMPCAADSGKYVLAHPDFGRFGPVDVTRVFRGTLANDFAAFQICFN